MNKNVLLLCVSVLSFVLGWACTTIYDNGGTSSSERTGFLPYDRVNESDIHVFEDRIVIEVENAWWTDYANTGSMEPVLGAGANGLQLVPKSEGDVRVGDIVVYEKDGFDGMIVHRVVAIGRDGEGTYYMLKGDNGKQADPGRVRFSQIRHVLIGVIYWDHPRHPNAPDCRCQFKALLSAVDR